MWSGSNLSSLERPQCVSSHILSCFVVVEDVSNCVCDCFYIADWYAGADAFVDQLTHAGTVHRHDRRAGLERLHNGDRQRLPTRCQQHNIGGTKISEECVIPAGEEQVGDDAFASGEFPHLPVERSVPNYNKAGASIAVFNASDAVNQNISSLLIGDPCIGHHKMRPITK